MADEPGQSIELADPAVDSALQLASAPFATWIGVIEAKPSGSAFLLRRDGEEDEIATDPALARRIEAVCAEGALHLVPGTAIWLPTAVLYPVLQHLSPADAFDVASRMAAPRVEFVDGGTRSPMELRAALIDQQAGWVAGCVVPVSP